MEISTKDGFKLNTIYHRGSTGKLVVFAHGMTVDLNDEEPFIRAELELQKLGFSTIRFDFRAHGKSSGQSIIDFNPSGELRDLEALFSFAKEHTYQWVSLAGASFGGSIAALYAGEHPDQVQKLLLANPVLDYTHCFLHPTTAWGITTFSNIEADLEEKGYVRVGSEDYKVGPSFFKEIKEFDPTNTLRKYDGPLLFIHGDADTYISHKDTIKCFNDLANNQKELKIIPDAEHGFDEEPYTSQVASIIVDFFHG